MSTINTSFRNYVFPLKDEDLESSNNLLRITTEAIDSDINALFTSKANSVDVDLSSEVDTKISSAISSFDSSLNVYGNYSNGDVNTDIVDNTKLVLTEVMGTPGIYTKVTVNGKGLVTAGGTISKSDISDFSESDYLHLSGTETSSGDKTFSGTINFTGTVVLPSNVTVPPSSVFNDTSSSSSTFGWSIDKISSYISGYVPLSSYTDSSVLSKVKNVDGSGSGLDSDLLDGEEGSFFLDWVNFTSTPITLSGYGVTDAYTKTEVDTLVVPTSSATASRPVVTTIGTMHFDTDLVKPIWWSGTDWVDATGTIV